MLRRINFLVVIGVIALLTPAIAVGASPVKVDPTLVGQLRKSGSTTAIVTVAYKDAIATASLRSSTAKRGEVGKSALAHLKPLYEQRKHRALAAAPGIRVIDDYSALPSVLVEVRSERALAALAGAPGVVGIQPVRSLKPALSQSLSLIRQPQAYADGYSGTGTAVAVLDTGIDYRVGDFGECPAAGAPGCRVVYEDDVAADDGSLDDDGHGTNVAAIAAGVAAGANIVGLDVFTRTEDGVTALTSDILEGVNFATNNQAQYNIRALNMSIGADGTWHTESCADQDFESAFATARLAGILPVVAAGNHAFALGQFIDGVSWPACVPGAVRVGAVFDADVGSMIFNGSSDYECTDEASAADQVTCFSQSGPLLSLLAPGAMITAGGIEQGGTSQAAPHVAGAAAVLAAASPASTPAQIQKALVRTGTPVTDSRNDQTNNRLDLPDALKEIDAARDLANAIAANDGDVTGASFVSVPDTGPSYAISDAGLTSFPTDGSHYGILSTGDATIAGDPNLDESTGSDLGGGNVRGDTDYDVTILKIDLSVPAVSNCLAFDFRFLSEEYEEFVGTAYNDAFIAELDNSTWSTSGSDISAANNFAFDPSGKVVSINTSGYASMSQAEATGTTYDGGTPALKATAPITPGAHSLYLSIFDQGDSAYDTSVFVDNLRLFGSSGTCGTGAQLKTPKVTEVAPAPGATGVSPTTNVSATFSNLMDPASTQSAFTLVNAATSATVAGTYAWSDKTMVFDPTSNLLKGVTYTATVSNSAQDISGSFAQARSWQFKIIRGFTRYPGSKTTIQKGSKRAGDYRKLKANDGSYYSINSTTSGTRTTSWYGSFESIPRSLSNLKIVYSGKNSRSCSQTLSLWKWGTSQWVQLDKRSVGTAEVAISKAASGAASSYVSGTGDTGSVRVRVSCSASAKFYASGDQMKIKYDAA